VPHWIYFIHPPRLDMAESLTEEEERVWGLHFERLQRLTAEGVVVLAGPTLGRTNTGITIFEAPDEAAARALMEGDPILQAGMAEGELRGFRLSLLAGRDGAPDSQ
jgi:uncharacterized protein YciI